MVVSDAKSSPPKLVNGELSPAATTRLEALIDRWDPLGELRAANSHVVPDESKSSNSRRSKVRLPPPGCMIRRTYQGRQICVRVLEKGFEYEGQHYRSLSAVAFAVTGAKWNGNLFFGFVRQRKGGA
ncbi:MAG: DUF2924 domain-containing protein [Phycisphaerales bacterium]|nr:DUF2924 domain-containing protein [Phycisphaerales bacterium]